MLKYIHFMGFMVPHDCGMTTHVGASALTAKPSAPVTAAGAPAWSPAGWCCGTWRSGSAWRGPPGRDRGRRCQERGLHLCRANPPYIRQEWIAPYKPYLRQAFKTFHGHGRPLRLFLRTRNAGTRSPILANSSLLIVDDRSLPADRGHRLPLTPSPGSQSPDRGVSHRFSASTPDLAR